MTDKSPFNDNDFKMTNELKKIISEINPSEIGNNPEVGLTIEEIYKTAQTIYKYKITSSQYNFIDLPTDAQILTVQIQNDEPHIWVLLNPKMPKVKWKFLIIPTGGQHVGIPQLDKKDYIGTFQLDSGALVFHVFAKIENGI